MSLNDVSSGERIHIAFFGCRNAGKSSLVNAVTGQDLAVVSEIRGTTTDPVTKSMELLPLGPVVIIDTPGYDDEGSLGNLRVKKTKQVLNRTDIAVLVVDATIGMQEEDEELLSLIQQRQIPCLLVWNKADLLEEGPKNQQEKARKNLLEENQGNSLPPGLFVSALTGVGVHELKEQLGALSKQTPPPRPLLSDLIQAGDSVILVCPIDESAPKGRLILPQQMAIRDVLDAGAHALVTREKELATLLQKLSEPPALVITDSQVFGVVKDIVPESVPLTSFSILMARYKGYLDSALEAVETMDHLKDGDRVLMAEGCTHHRQCGDIGTVKIPGWLRKHANCKLEIDTCSGREFPEDLSPYALVIHCGGCMLTERDVQTRMRTAADQGVPFCNYGIAIAAMKGILERSTAML